MAGHSKFKNIMHRKGAQDAKRAKIFTKIGREITTAARMSGADINSNPRLRAAIQAARAANMTNDRVKRAIDAGIGGGEAENYVEMRYEGYGPNGVAIIVEALTNNKNRTAGDVRAAFSKLGGNLGETNSVSFMFERCAEIVVPKEAGSFDDIFEAAVEAGASDVEEDETDGYIVYADTDQLSAVREALTEKLGELGRSGFIWNALTKAPIADLDAARTVFKLIDVLEDNDDVQTVTTNIEVSDEIVEKLSAEG